MKIFAKHGTLLVGFAVILLSIVYLEYVDSKANIQFVWLEYRSTTSRKASGELCHYESFPSVYQCDPYFVFCLSENIFKQNCTTSDFKTYSGDHFNSIDFTGTFNDKKSNSMEYSIEKFNESTGVTFSVFYGNREDPFYLITEMSSQLMAGSIKVHPGPSSSNAHWQYRTLSNENGEIAISFKFRVWCHQYYHGPECAVYCRGINSKDGHYSCSRSGEKKCKNGWTDPETNCTVPHSPCAPYPCSINTPQINLDANSSYPDLVKLLIMTKEETLKQQMRQLIKTKLQLETQRINQEIERNSGDMNTTSTNAKTKKV